MLEGVLTLEQVGWVRSHHEWWAGGGYPDGLIGDAIPDGARVIAVANTWDAIAYDGAPTVRPAPPMTRWPNAGGEPARSSRLRRWRPSDR